MTVPFDPYDPAYLADPYPYFARYRAESPVFNSLALGHWAIFRYNDVRTALRDWRRFSTANTVAPVEPLCPAAVALMQDAGMRSVPALVGTDPPLHTRLRRILNTAFTPRLMAEMEGYVRELAVRLINDQLTGDRAEVVRAFAWELPAQVIFRLLGIPDNDIPLLKSWAGSRAIFQFGRPIEGEQIAISRDMVAFWHYAQRLIADHQEWPKDDFISTLLAGRDQAGEPLSPTEAATLIYGLLFAGHETTTYLLTSAVRRLAEHPAAWRAICREPGLIPNAVEEILRYDPPGMITRRRTTVPVTIRDVEIPAGANLLVAIGSANRDEAVFADPERFDIRRENARLHLSFGSGNHLCVGAPLARLEVRVVLEELARLRADFGHVSDQTLNFLPNIALRAPTAYLVDSGVA